MCGIAGSLIINNLSNPVKALYPVVNALKHRGPDFQKIENLGDIQLAHTRLAIIDLDHNSNQPMFSDDRNLCITFNGEIYNYIELKKSLIGLGHRFTTKSDTEVLLKSWQEWGVDCLEKIIGMFAFALWNIKQKSLYLVRDRMGEKPLYYTCPNTINDFSRQGILFASELTALMQHQLAIKQINYQAINHFLSLNYVMTNQCIYEGVVKLPPAHYLVYKPGSQPETHCYWDLAQCYQNEKTKLGFTESLDKFTEIFNSSVAMQLRSDVRLGAFLSGGLDSSSVVAAMARCTEPKNIHTFSIDFPEKSYSESYFSKTVSGHLNIKHHIKDVDLVTPTNFSNILKHFDEPFADSSLIPCYLLAKYTRKFVTVALSGDGADELFTGYDTYTADKYYQVFKFLPNPLLKICLSLFQSILPPSFAKVSFDYKIQKFISGLMHNQQQAHYSWREIFTEHEKQQLCNTSTLLKFGPTPDSDYCSFFDDVAGCNWQDQCAYVDIKTWLTDDILVKVDRSSMAHSLEVRTPFLNHKLVEFCTSLPTQWKLNAREKKYFLKKSQERHLPQKIIYRKKKGFNAPISYWLLSKEMQEFTQKSLFTEAMLDLFSKPHLEQIWQSHLKRQSDNSLKLFGLISLSNWIEQNYLGIQIKETSNADSRDTCLQ